jgi:hypothetical protein
MTASKRRKALAPGQAKPSGEVVDEVQSSHKPLQLPAGKRKATELSTSDGVSEPHARRTAPSALAVEASAAVCAADELTAGTSRQPRPMEGRPAYAAVVVGRAAPRQENGPLKPTAKVSGTTEPAASPEAEFRPTSLADVSGPLSGMPAGTNPDNPIETTTVIPAGEQHNRTPIYVSGVTDSRGFLAWWRDSCPSGLSAQIKGERLTLVPKKADVFRATVSALRSLDGSKGVSFHTFSLPEDRYIRLLLKNLGKHLPESVVREELEPLGIHVQGVLQLRSRRRDQDVARDRTLTPNFIVSVARGAEAQTVRSLTEVCGLLVSVESYVAPKAPQQCKRCQLFGHTQRNCGYPSRCVACGEVHLSWECTTPKQHLKCCSCGGNHTANYRGCLKWKEAKAALVKWGQPESRQSSRATGRPAAPKHARAGPSAEQERLGPGWNNVVKGGRVVMVTVPTPPQSSPKSITAAPDQSEASVTKKGGAAANRALKSTKAHRQAKVKNTQEKMRLVSLHVNS